MKTLMPRSILPYTMTILGITIAALATNMPLLTWQISEVTTGFSRETRFDSCTLTTRPGESLEDRSSTIFQVNAYKGESSCLPVDRDINFKRSKRDESIEQVALAIEEPITAWLFDPALRTLIPFVCGIYIWVFTFLHRRPIAEAVAFSAIAIFTFCFLIAIWKLLLYKIGNTFISGSYYETLTLSARLSAIHPETLIVFFLGVLLELGAFGEILLQIVRVVFRKAFAKSVVG